MGLLDSVAGIMGVFAVNYINNAAMIVLLQQAAIPISMSISKMFLGATYTVSQVGARRGIYFLYPECAVVAHSGLRIPVNKPGRCSEHL